MVQHRVALLQQLDSMVARTDSTRGHGAPRQRRRYQTGQKNELFQGLRVSKHYVGFLIHMISFYIHLSIDRLL